MDSGQHGQVWGHLQRCLLTCGEGDLPSPPTHGGFTPLSVRLNAAVFG